MGTGASTAGKAITDASEQELQDALTALPAKDKSKVQLALAWAALSKKVNEDKFLVSEVEAMHVCPPRVIAAEEALLNLCSFWPEAEAEAPNVHSLATLNFYKSTEEMQAEMDVARAKTFADALAAVKTNADSAAALAEYCKDPANAPDEVGKRSLLMKHVAEWLHALNASEGADGAMAALVKKIDDDKGALVSEMAAMVAPPKSVLAAEELLCKLCGFEGILYGDTLDWHLTVRGNLCKLPEEVDAKAAEVMNQSFLTALGAVKADAETGAKLSEYVKNPDNAVAEVRKQSMLFEYVATWLHALHAYSALL